MNTYPITSSSRAACWHLLLALALVLMISRPATAEFAIFDSNTDSIALANGTTLGTTATFEAVFAMTSTVGGSLFFEQRDGPEWKRLSVSNGGVGGVGFASGAITTSMNASAPVVLRVFHHVAWVRDGAQERLYFDGVLVGSRTVTNADIGDEGTHPAALGANRYMPQNLFEPGFIGVLDSLRISTVARYSGATITAPTGDMTSDANTQLLMNFDLADVTGNVVADVSGSGRDGTLGTTFPGATKPTIVAAAPLNQRPTAGDVSPVPYAMFTDGVNDYATVPHHAVFDALESGNEVTFEGWMRVQAYSPSPYFSLFDKYEATPGPPVDFGWLLTATTESGGLNFIANNDSSSWIFSSSSTGQVAVQEWTHVAVTVNQVTLAAALYKNGEEIRRVTLPARLKDTDGEALFFGTSPSGGDEFFNGNYSEVRMWNRVLPEAEIKQRMFTQATGKETGLVSAWSMDEGSGTTLGNRVVGAPVGAFQPATAAPTWSTNVPPLMRQRQHEATTMGNAVTFALRGVDLDGDTLLAKIKSLPTNGSLFQFDGTPITAANTVVTDAQNRVTYVPTSGFTGVDTLTFSMSDAGLESADALLSVNVTATATTRTTWSAGDDFHAIEKPDDANDTSNPNALVPEWSYGTRPAITGTVFTALTPAQHGTNLGGQAGVEGYGFDSSGSFGVNTRATAVTYNFGSGPLQPLSPREILMQPGGHPSGTQELPVLRWTAPYAGTFAVDATWRHLDHNGGDGVSANIVVNGVPLPSQNASLFPATLFRANRTTFEVLTLNAGDIVDFVTGKGPGTSVTFDTTGFTAKITRVQNVYDAGKVISRFTGNPNGVWRYGAKPSVDGALTLFQLNDRGGDSTLWHFFPSTTNFGIPVVAGFGQSQFFMSPSSASPAPYTGLNFTTVRFTAPKTGRYRVFGFFSMGDVGSIDGHLRRGTEALFDTIISGTNSLANFDRVVDLSAGQTLDLIMGPNVSQGNDNTGERFFVMELPAPPPTTVAHYRFEDGPGAVGAMLDSGPYLLHGTTAGTLTHSTDRPANPESGSFTLDARGDSNYGQIADTALLHQQGDFTVEMFFKADAPYDQYGSPGFASLAAKLNTTVGGDFLAGFEINSAHTGEVGGSIGFGSGVGVGIAGTSNTRDGQWHHVALVMDRDVSGTTDELRIYIDGVLQGSTQGVWPDLFYGDQPLYIGAGNFSGPASAFRRNFDGHIDEFRLSSAALTPAQFLSNLAPTVITLNDTEVLEEEPVGTVVVTLSGTDPNTGDTLTFSLVPGAGDSSNGNFTIVGNELRTAAVFDHTLPSSHPVRIRATDAGGKFIEQTFTITVTPVNDVPTLAAISDPTAILEDAGQQTMNLSGIGTGAPNETQVLTVTATSSNPALIPNPTVTYTSPNVAGILSYTPVANAHGTAVITVTVTDDGGTANGGVNTISRTFTVTVTPVNDAPTLAAISDPAAILEDAGQQTVNLADIGVGALDQTQVLTVTAASSNTALIPNPTVTYASPNATGSLSFTPVANLNGTAEITVTVTDDGGTANGGVDTSSRTFTVTVLAVNDAPTLAAITDPAAMLEDAAEHTINLAGIGTGAANETQVLTVTATSNNTVLIPNPTVTYTSPDTTGSLSYAPVADVSGTAVITVTVTDDGDTANGGVNTISRTFTVTVTAVNDAPTLAMITDPATILQNSGQQTVNLSGVGTGAPDETQSLAVTATSSNTALIPNPTVTYTSPEATGSLSYTPVADANGTAVITVTVTDDGGTANGGVNSFVRTFTVVVTPLNRAPTLAVITDPAAIFEDAAQQTVNLAGIGTGALDETQVLTVTATSSNMALIPNPTVTYTSPEATGSLSYTPVANAIGTAVITVTVTDDGGTTNGGVDTFVRTFTVQVLPVNDAPTFSKGANITHFAAATSAQTVPGWATNLSPGPVDEVAQTLAFNITGNSNPDIFTTAPAISSSGTLTYRLSGTAGTSTVSVTLSDNGGTENGGADTSAVQTFTFTVTEVESDYLVTTENGVLTLTDITGNDTTVTVSEPSVGNVLFAASGRSFTVNGLTLTNDNSAPISLAGITQIIIQLQGGNDALNIRAFANPTFPGLTIHGGEGDDTISFLGDLTFAPNASLEVDLQDDVANPGADTILVGSLLSSAKCELRLSGTGGAILRASARIQFDSPSSGTIPTLLQTENGNVVIEANLQTTPTLAGAVAAPAVLIQLASTVRSAGTGNISIRAKGHTTTSTSGEYSGITIVNGGRVLSHEGDISMEGTCGRNTGVSTSASGGLRILDFRTSPATPVTAVRSTDGDISLAGFGDSGTTTGITGSIGAIIIGTATALPEIITGGVGDIRLTGDCRGTGSSNSISGLGLSNTRLEAVDGDIDLSGFAKDQGTTDGSSGVFASSLIQVRSTGAGAVRITGKGGAGTATSGSSGSNLGIVWSATVGSFIKTESGDIALTGTPGSGSSTLGLYRSPFTGSSSLWESVSGSIRLTADSMNLEGTGTLTITTGPTGQVVIKPETPSRSIELRISGDQPGTLSLSPAEINRITTTGQLIIGSADAGQIQVLSPISRTVAVPVRLVSSNLMRFLAPLATVGGQLTLSHSSANAIRFPFGVTDLDLGASSVSFTPGSKLQFAIGGLTTNTQYEQLSLKGGVNLTGAVLDLVQTGSFVPGAGTWTLISNDGTDPIVGTFEGLPEGALISHAGIQMRISYVGGTGNDVVLTRVPGLVGFDPIQYVFNEEDGTVNLRLTRTGGTDGAVSVTVNTPNGTGAGKAAAGVDYTSIIGQVVTFAHGETEKNVPLTLLTDALKEGAETLTVRLSLPGLGGALRTGAADATVKIIDAGDTTPPGVALSTPAANARITSLSQLIIKGSAGDNAGLRRVEYSINGSPFADADTTFSSLATSATFSVPTPSVLPPGLNTISVRSVDMRGNASPTISRTFTLVVMSPLTVTRVGSGTLSAGYPGTKSVELASYVTLTATPASGQVFAGWRNVNNTPSIGLTATQLEGAKITFLHQPGLALEATFIPNPFVAGIIGTFNGVLLPSSTEPAPSGTTPSYEQCGSITLTVTSTGSFSGSLRLGSVVKPLTGVFNTSGAARFGTTRSTSTGFTVEDSSLTASFTMDMTGTTGKLTGTVLRLKRGNQTAAVSVIDADRAHFSATNKLPASLAGTTTTGKPYTMALLLRPDQHPDLTEADYPQGDGFMTASLLPTGMINYVHTSPDDLTYTTGSTTVSKLLEWPLHALSTTGKGSLTGRVKIDESQPDTDMTASEILWFRSFLNRQWYPYGWDEGLVVDLIGTKYEAVSGRSILGGLGAADADGNAQITFTAGGLAAPHVTSFNLSTSDVSSFIVTTQLWGFSVDRSNGTFRSHFYHPDSGFCFFHGVVLQKGIHQKGFGFFRTPPISPLDYMGQIGRLRLEAQP